eukprot:451342-Pyramimonas_sp.AAC.1
MVLVDHVDQSAEMQLLRGRLGRIVELVVEAEDSTICGVAGRQLHGFLVIVLVDFGTAEWILEGKKERGGA